MSHSHSRAVAFRQVVAALACFVAGVQCLAAQSATTAQTQPPAWKEYRSVDGRFIVTMPCEPEVSSGTTETDLGQVEIHTSACSGDAMYCSVIYQDMPEGLARSPGDILGRLCDGFVQGASVREITERRDVVVGGIAGRQLEGESKDGNFRLVVCYLVVGQRIYTLVAGVPVEVADNSQPNRYIESFRLLK